MIHIEGVLGRPDIQIIRCDGSDLLEGADHDLLRQHVIDDSIKFLVVSFPNCERGFDATANWVIRTRKHMRERNGIILMANLSPQLSDMFRVISLDRIMDIHPDVSSALDQIPDDSTGEQM